MWTDSSGGGTGRGLALIILAVFAAVVLWWQPWTVLAGNPVLDPATSVSATATSLPTPMPLPTSCDTSFDGGMWMCRGSIEYTTSTGQAVNTTVLLPDTVRRSRHAAKAAAGSDEGAPDCSQLEIRYQPSDPTRVALAQGNPGQLHRFGAFAALLVFPCSVSALAAALPTYTAIVGIAGWWKPRATSRAGGR